MKTKDSPSQKSAGKSGEVDGRAEGQVTDSSGQEDRQMGKE